MTGDHNAAGRSPAPRNVLQILSATLVLIGAVVFAGVGLVAVLGQRGNDRTWARWSSVGEAFGVVNSVVSALAVLALVVTWALQTRELRDQNIALSRSADVQVRQLHVTLTRMALDNPHLADVWPSNAGVEPVTQSQYMYANLLLQHVWLQYTSGKASREEMISNLRFFFASPKVRDFWRDTANSRHRIYVHDTEEFSLAAVADEISREYEAVLACTGDAGQSANASVRRGEDPAEPPNRPEATATLAP